VAASLLDAGRAEEATVYNVFNIFPHPHLYNLSIAGPIFYNALYTGIL
jgi:hypothetical protein